MAEVVGIIKDERVVDCSSKSRIRHGSEDAQ